MTDAAEPSLESRPSGARADRKRRAIVAAAQETFLTDGYDASMETIAGRADVSKATMYNHFGSKEALFSAVIGDALDRALGDAVEQARIHQAAIDDARVALTRTMQALVDGVADPDVLAIRNLVTGELRRFPEMGRAWRASGPDRAAAMLADLLQRLVERGDLEIPDVPLAVIQLLALTLYPHLTASSYGGELPRRVKEQLVPRGVDLFLRAYSPAA